MTSILKSMSGVITGIVKTMSPRAKFFFRQFSIYVLFILVFIASCIVVSRASFARAEKMYDERYEAAVAALRAENEAMKAMPLSEEAILIQQAERLAKVLYGVRDNSTDDLRTLCWCVFNRIENPAFPNTLEEVIDQPSQWMRYDPDNPVLEDLYEIARAELDTWKSDAHRPCDNSFCFMDWSEKEIRLRNEFNIAPSTRYWRIK